MKSRKRSRLVLALLALVAVGARAQGGPESFHASWSVLVIPVMDPEAVSRVANPALVFDLGAGLRIPLDAAARVSFEPAADFYWSYYEYSDEGGPWPTTVEERMAFVLGLVVDAPFFFRIPLGEKFRLDLGAGPAFDLRYGFMANEAVREEDPAYLAALNRYFWESGRFFMPSTTIRAEYRLTERVGFGFAVRALWPVFNLWDDDGIGFPDQGILSCGIVIRYGLR